MRTKMPIAQFAEMRPKICSAGMMISGQQKENKKGRSPNQIVDEDGDEAAADAGERHLDGHELRGIDVKLISNRLHGDSFSPISGSQSAALTGIVWPRCWARRARAACGSFRAPSCAKPRCFTGRRRAICPRCARTRPRGLTPSTSTNYWLAPTISFIPAGAKASSRFSISCAMSIRLIVQRQIRYVLLSLVMTAGRGAAGLGAHAGASAVHAPHAGAGDGRNHRAPRDVDALDCRH